MRRSIWLGVLMLPFAFRAQTLPQGIVMKDIDGGTFTMGSNNLIGSPDQQSAAPEHEVTLSPYSISEAEITNAQYVIFLNQALEDGWIEVIQGTSGPDNGKRLIQGTSLSSYEGKTLYSLDGIRVMKDHDDADNDGNPFTGDIEPENPLNIAYIDYDENNGSFYVKDPHDLNDFNWMEICDYYDYGSVQGTYENELKNDFEDWSGGGQNFSSELAGWTPQNPDGASNLPTKSEVEQWPVTFVRWWGAKAFAIYYGYQLPTEAQWEYAAKGGQDFVYAVHDGTDISDANWNQDVLPFATHHVRNVISGSSNPFGLYNLAGNAWEWIEDNYEAPYSTNATTDPLIENGTTLRCWRGGSWNYHEATLQSSIRFSDEENRGNDHFGFRIAKNATSTGYNSIELNTIRFYPNPATESISLTITSTSVEVYDNCFHLVKEMRVINGNQVDVSSLACGIYYIGIESRYYPLVIVD